MKQRSVDPASAEPVQPYYRAGRPRPDAEPAPDAELEDTSATWDRWLAEYSDSERAAIVNELISELLGWRNQYGKPGTVSWNRVDLIIADARKLYGASAGDGLTAGPAPAQPPIDPDTGAEDTATFWRDRLARWPAAALAGSSAAAGFLRGGWVLAAEVEELREAQIEASRPAAPSNTYANLLALSIALDIKPSNLAAALAGQAIGAGIDAPSELARKLTIPPASPEAKADEQRHWQDARIDEATRKALETEAIRQRQYAHGMYLKLRAGGWNPDTGELSVPATAGASVDVPAVDQDRPADGPDQASEQSSASNWPASIWESYDLALPADSPAAGAISAEPAARAEPMTAEQLADDDLSRELSGFKPPMFGPRGLAARIAESVRKESEARQKLAGGQATDGRTTDDDQ